MLAELGRMNRVRTSVAIGAAVAMVVLGSVSGLAAAEKIPVRISSRPSKATLYLDSRDSEPIGKTPYEGALNEGTYTLIVELEGHEAAVQTIRVKKKKNNRPLSFSAELEKMRSATLELKPAKGDSSAVNARVLVDGVEQGNVPDKIIVAAGPHQIEVVKEGFKTFETWVEPQEGDELPIEVTLEPDGSRRGKKVATDDDDDGDDDDEVAIGGEAKSGAGRSRGPLVVARLGLEFGGRTFSYAFASGPGGTERDYEAGGVPMGRIDVELYPLATLGIAALGGLGVSASYAQAAPLDSEASDGSKIATAWSEFAVAGRYQFVLGGGHHVGAEVGIGGQDFDFTPGMDSAVGEDELPEVSYRYLRFGLDGRAALGERFAIYAGGEYRQVNELGALATRYSRTTVSSFGFGLGFGYAVTRAIEARLDGDFVRYSHAFTPAGGVYQASAGTDQFFGVALGAAFRY
jgi:hypothetical protein